MHAITPESVLRSRGPLLSSELVRALEESGATGPAARQRMKRALSIHSGPIRRLARLSFRHNQKFLYLQHQYRSPAYWEALLRGLWSSGSTYGHATASLELRGGVAPVHLFGVLSGSPSALKGHLSSGKVLEILEEEGLLERSVDPSLGELVMFTRFVPLQRESVPVVRARLIAEDLAIAALSSWLRNNGIVSFGKVATRPPLGSRPGPDFAHLEWDLTAPSYVSPFVQGQVPGFVVADVVLGEDVRKRAAGYFLNKFELVRRQQKVRPTLAILVAQRFAPDALRLGRSAGAVFTTPGAMFGEDVGSALEALVGVLANAAKVVSADPGKIDKLMSELSRIEGAALNLRGPLFEMIVGMCVGAHNGTSIDMGVIATEPETDMKADIDVLAIRGRSDVWAYECKGKAPHSAITLREVQDWLERQVPRIIGWLGSESRFADHVFGVAFWTSGHFEQEAISYLKAAATQTMQFSIAWKDGDEVYSYAEAAQHQYAKKLLNEHFRKHPLSGHFRESL